MGFDIKATADAAGKAMDSLPTSDTIMSSLPSLDSLKPLTGFLYILGAAVVVSAFMKHTTVGRRIRSAIEEVFFTNWRLALLGSTSLVLSLVAGYTTFDGLRNFTGGGTLSLAATFGIQGVMLVTAWLIGESFAAGMSHRPVKGAASAGIGGRATPWLGSIIGILFFIALATLIMNKLGAGDLKQVAASGGGNWSALGDKLLIVAVGLLGIALIALYAASDIVSPYLAGGRVILKNTMLWVMFLACMSVSVFFSFDSHFSGIFPQAERIRAAELRAQNQVSGIIASINEKIVETRLSEAESLFGSEGWRVYDAQLENLGKAAAGSTGQIEEYFNSKLEERNRAIKQQQERIATAQSGQAGLATKKTSLTDELSQLEAGRPALAAEYAEKKAALDARAKEVDAKRVEAMAEDKGVEGTGKAGRGPMYRQRMDELGKLQDYLKIGEERVKDAQKRLSAAETRIASIKRELAALDGDLAKYKGEAETAEQRIKLAQEQLPSDANARVDPARVVPAFETARADFRQDPTPDRLIALQRQCSQLYNAMAQTEVTKQKVKGLDCDPKAAAEAASVVFALVSGTDMFAKTCQGGERLAQYKTTDELFGFARKCLSDSGLPPKQTDQLRSTINFIELNRDDKAHRFVVTWNAFLDGNRLAYLALAIAITIDGLVFMSGLFGANAVRSPLQDVPSLKARTAHQLESIIENALLPHKYESAKAIIDAMRPMTPHDGFTARVHIDEGDPHAADIARVLNAGAAIGAVRYTGGSDYELRAELFEFLSIVAKKQFEADKKHVNMAELEKIVGVALLPEIGENAQVVLDHMHPITEDRGFTAEIHLAEIDEQHKRVVRNALNAGATLQVVQRVGTDTASYFIHGDFYKALARIRARTLVVGSGQQRLAGPQQGGAAQVAGGRLDAAQPQLAAAPQQPQIAPPPIPLDRDAVRRFYRGEMLAAIGLNDSTVERRLATPGLQDAALDAWKELSRLAQRNHRLDTYIRWHQEGMSQSLAQVNSSLRTAADGDQAKVDLLDEVDNEIERQLPILMLFKETQLVDSLIDNLESAASHDGGLMAAEQELLDSLRGVRFSMDQLDLATVEAWQHIGRALRALDVQAFPNVVRAPRRSNDNSRG
jgi:hypothetical protein